MLGKCTWFEIPISNDKKSREFYTAVFSWKLKKIEHSTEKNREEIWHIYTEGEHPIGALFVDLKKCGGYGIEIFLVVNDIKEAQSKAEQFGGKTTVEKTPVPEGSGYYSKLRDPDGNLIGIWSKQ